MPPAGERPPGRLLGRRWYERDAWDVAPSLLNKILAVWRPDGGGWRWVRLVEVEAYCQTDPASHSFGGPRGRNMLMFGPAGVLYVYFTYGMHWCANIVTGHDGSGQAVLLRAGEPLGGVEAMQAARGRGVAARDLCRGPARLAQALGISGADYGTPVMTGRGGPGRGAEGGRGVAVAVLDDGVAPPAVPGVGPRVGISKATDVPWRWWVPGSPWASAFKAGGRRR